MVGAGVWLVGEEGGKRVGSWEDEAAGCVCAGLRERG